MNFNSFKSYFLIDNFKSLLNRQNKTSIRASTKSSTKSSIKSKEGPSKFNFCVKFLTMSLSLAGMFVFCLANIQKAHAQVLKSQGVYMDGGLGWGQVSEKVSGVSNKNSGVAWNGNLGYLFNPMLGAEIGFWSFPRTKVNGTVFTKDNYSVDLSLKGIINVHERFGIYAKAGIAQVTTKFTNTSTVGVTSVSDGSHSRITGIFGIGASYHIDEHTYFGIEGVATIKRDPVPSMRAVVLTIGYIL